MITRRTVPEAAETMSWPQVERPDEFKDEHLRVARRVRIGDSLYVTSICGAREHNVLKRGRVAESGAGLRNEGGPGLQTSGTRSSNGDE